jgi:DNA modification methylase
MACRIIRGDCREVLPTLPANFAHTTVTSPPYWGQRDYLPDEHPDKEREIGREARLQDYVENLVQVFREVRRVLHPTGTLWLNLGDTYAARTGVQHYSPERDNQNGFSATVEGSRGQQKFARNSVPTSGVYRDFGTLKPKQLCGVPWRVALALQDDGWWLRSDCIWRKPNPKTESVKDRPSRGHEYLFLLSKSEEYHFDHFAIREPVSEASLADARRLMERGKPVRRYRARRTVWDVAAGCYPGAHTAVMPEELAELCILAGTSPEGCCRECRRPFERMTKETVDDFGFTVTETIGWGGCRCAALEQILGGRCCVLDPFGGTGTTGLMASKLGHDSIVIELNPANVEQAEERNRQGGLGL